MRSALRRMSPVVAVAAIYLAVVIGVSHFYDFNLSCFLCVGCKFPFADSEHFAPGTVKYTTVPGYDGSDYYIIARDPLLIKRDFLTDYKTDARLLRYQRPLYPLLVNLLSFDRPELFPCTMLLINILCGMGMTAILVLLLEQHGANRWLSLLFTAGAGMLFAFSLDMQMHLSLLPAVAGIYYREKHRTHLMGLMFALSLLAWESCILFIAPIALYELLRKRTPVFLACCVSVVPFFINQLYFARKLGAGFLSGSGCAVNLPFVGLVQSLSSLPLDQGWVRLIRSSLVIPPAVFFAGCLVLAVFKLRRRWDNVYTIMLLVQALYAFIGAKDAWLTFANITRVNAGIFVPLIFSFSTDREKYSKWLFAAGVVFSLLALFRIFYDARQPYVLL